MTSRAFDSSKEGQDAPPERHQQTLQKKMGRCPLISLTATVAVVALPAPPYHQHPSAATGGQVTVTPIRTASVRTPGMLIKSNVIYDTPLFVFSISDPKQNARSLLTPVSGTVFYAFSHGSLAFALHAHTTAFKFCCPAHLLNKLLISKINLHISSNFLKLLCFGKRCFQPEVAKSSRFMCFII